MALGRANYRLFWQEFRRTFHSTGALLPSGPQLSRALARQIAPADHPQRILEVGPGTGVVTDKILQRMGPGDTLDLVELNERFVENLRARLASDATWRSRADQVQIHHLPIESHCPSQRYQRIVSGLPLNNFPAELVDSILGHLRQLADDGATLSFFEYIGVRKAKALVSRTTERQRLAQVEEVLRSACRKWRFDRDGILANVPPAWVHHLRFTEASVCR
jgi:phospholipid N-methyltransferase